MEHVTRRKLIQAGAVGTVTAGLGTVARLSAAGAAPERVGGVHIHGSLKQTKGPFGDFGRIVDVTVYGPDDNLNGFGWDANPASPGSHDPAVPDRTQCFSSQRGSVQGDTVKLMGRNLFWQNPGDDGAPVTIEANLSTGQIKWATTPTQGEFVFEGVGDVARI
ncbi:MAG TPA: hypothetical protein VGL92_16005 [Acidimicrobiia bacterium]|jgi:hypothetical protein